MINWKDMDDLHVIQKLRQIISKWFGAELYFVNKHGEIQNAIFDKDSTFVNDFMKVQMSLSYGHEYIKQDLEQAIEKLQKGNIGTIDFKTFFPCIEGVVSEVNVEGEFNGAIVAYPYTNENSTGEEIKELKSKLLEYGASEEDVEMGLQGVRRIGPRDKEYLMELVELVAQEIITFHLEIEKREERISELNSELGTKYRYHSMIGKSKKMQSIYRLLEKISKSESTVLIQGENGTGKELVAKAIHYFSSRKNNVFLAQNCSAFNDNLLDSELFGHVKGAFTGAIKDKKGLFEMANAGTLFLDEIGDTSLTMQVKLLRVLQEGTFLPVGATASKKVNVRVIAATNKNLHEMIKNGEFREDLYYRINVINVGLPSLRERKEDIALLVDHFLERRCAEAGTSLKVISKKCMERILDFSWPGNVRELENEIERLVVLAGDNKSISPDMLSSKLLENDQGHGGIKGVRTSGGLKDALEELELVMIREGLKRCNYNKSKLAKELGISRAGLIMKVEKYGLDKRKKVLDAS